MHFQNIAIHLMMSNIAKKQGEALGTEIKAKLLNPISPIFVGIVSKGKYTLFTSCVRQWKDMFAFVV